MSPKNLGAKLFDLCLTCNLKSQPALCTPKHNGNASRLMIEEVRTDEVAESEREEFGEIKRMDLLARNYKEHWDIFIIKNVPTLSDKL